MKVRFIGSEAGIGAIELKRFGQAVELPPEVDARTYRRAMCIPEEQYLACGFTAEEEKRYAVYGSHAEASPEFLAKKAAAVKVLQEAE